MNFDPDFYDEDLANQILTAVENDYGRSIVRIPRFEKTSRHTFDITIIFSDYRLFEATIKVHELYGMPSITIDGIYH